MTDNKYTGHEPELINCANDFVHFCETYVKIVHPIKGLIDFKLHEFQKRYVKTLEDHRLVIGKKFRQGGFSTVNMAWLTWRFLFKFDESNMVVCKSDREAVYCSGVVREILSQLPEWMTPEYGKFNDHHRENTENNNRIFFHTTEACRGRAINHLFIEEAAFIKNMDAHWKAMWPVLSTGGHCVVMSSVNGKKNNWFYETYNNAEAGTNAFHIFTSSYTEHPDYNNPEWVEQMKKNLGDRGWRQEILCEFLDEREPEEDIPMAEPVEEFGWLDPIEIVEPVPIVEVQKEEPKPTSRLSFDGKVTFTSEEVLKELTEKISEDRKFNWWPDKAEKKKKDHDLYKKLEADAEAYAKQITSKSDGFYAVKTPLEEQKVLHELRKKAYERHGGRPSNLVGDGITHSNGPTNFTWGEKLPVPIGSMINFDHVDRPHSFRCYTYPDVAEEFSEYQIGLYDDHSLEKCIDIKKQNLKDLEERVNEGVTDELLRLAGIISEDEAQEIKHVDSLPSVLTDKEVLAKVKEIGNFPETLQVSFSDKRLCVNGVQTNIKEFDLCCLYSGLLAFGSHNKAITKVAKIICKKLTPLFGVRAENE